MATLYQIHSSMDNLKRCTNQIALTWRVGDSLILLGSTVAFIDWFNACLADNDIQGIHSFYALVVDVAQLCDNAQATLNINDKLTDILTDSEWVTLTQDKQFDKVVTIAL